MTRPVILSAAALGAGVLALCACSAPRPPQTRASLPTVKVQRCRMQNWAPELETHATIVQRGKADVYPSSSLPIASLHADEGDRVVRGGLLARLESAKLALQLEEMKAVRDSRVSRLHLAEERLVEARRAVQARLSALERLAAGVEQAREESGTAARTWSAKQELHKAGGVPDAELDRHRITFLESRTRLFQAEKEVESAGIGLCDEDLQAAGLAVPAGAEEKKSVLMVLNTRLAAAELEAARAELAASEAQLRSLAVLIGETVIRSPIAGVVGSRYYDPGERAETGRPLFTIIDDGGLYAQAELSEKDLSAVALGQAARISLEAGPSLHFEGRVRFMSPYISPETRTARVRVEVLEPSRLLKPGLLVSLAIRTAAERRALIVPASAVTLEQEGRRTALVVRDGRVFRTELEVGALAREQAVIVKGLAEQDLVVLSPPAGLRDGMEVKLETEKP